MYAMAREVAATVDLAAMPLLAQQAFFADDSRLFRSDFKFVHNPPYASKGSPLRGVHEVVRALRIEADALVLVLDQFEELFTLCKDKAQRKAFVDNLLAAACPDPDASCQPAETSTLVVLTLRADFYAQCSEFDNLRLALERYQRYIGAMSEQLSLIHISEPTRPY